MNFDSYMAVVIVAFVAGMVLGGKMMDFVWSSNADVIQRHECGGKFYKVMSADRKHPVLEIERLKAALQTAILGLKDLAEPCTRYDYDFHKLNEVTCAIAQDRLNKTLEALKN